MMRPLSDDYTAFFRAEYEGVVRTVELMLGDHEAALDVTQDAFVRLYRHWKRVSRYEQPGSFVRRVAINLAISQLRRRRVQERALQLLASPASGSPIEDDGTLGAIRRLPPSQRAAVVLFYYEDQPSSEVARIMGCSESTVRVHLHKARAKLASLLTSDVTERSADAAR